MSSLTRSCSIFLVTVAAGAGARAAVISIASEIRSEVQSFFDGEPESSDLAIEEFGETGLELPISTEARLETVDSAGLVEATGVGITDFRDPAESNLPDNPQEFGLEADCFSLDGATHYEISNTAIEKREVVFSADELRDPPDGIQTVESRVFLSGAVFIWSQNPLADLTGVSATLRFVVHRVETDGLEEELFNEEIAVQGGPLGVIEVINSEAVSVFTGGVDDLPVPFPGEFVGQQGEPEFVNLARVVVIPDQELPYRYEASVDEPFALEATVTVEVRNHPGGTGVGAVFGRSFEVLAEVIESSVPLSNGLAIQSRVNRAIRGVEGSSLTAVAREGDAPRIDTLSPFVACGALGLESLLVVGLTFALLARPMLRSTG